MDIKEAKRKVASFMEFAEGAVTLTNILGSLGVFLYLERIFSITVVEHVPGADILRFLMLFLLAKMLGRALSTVGTYLFTVRRGASLALKSAKEGTTIETTTYFREMKQRSQATSQERARRNFSHNRRESLIILVVCALAYVGCPVWFVTAFAILGAGVQIYFGLRNLAAFQAMMDSKGKEE